jgi:predicted AAA+ superfamily ATPase
MSTYFPRLLEQKIRRSLAVNPVTAIIGARQCGKSAIARNICKNTVKCLYLDLQNKIDLNKIKDDIKAIKFLEENMDGLIVIDEVQFRPEIFPMLRVLADRIAFSRDADFKITHPGRFLILGSAAPELLRQSSESLAGRISFKRLATLLVTEIPDCDMEKYFIRGGFPISYLADTVDDSLGWRDDYVSILLKRDITQWGNYTSETMDMIWGTLISFNGQVTDYSRILSSKQIPNDVALKHIRLLKGLFLVDTVPLFSKNLVSRLSRNPKTYITDSGLVTLHIDIDSFQDFKLPNNSQAYGAIWESIVLNHLRVWYPQSNRKNLFYYRDKKGNEIDFILKKGNKLIAIECKTSEKAHLSSGAYAAMNILHIPEEHAFVVAPFPCSSLGKTITLPELHTKIENIFNKTPV